MILMSLITPDRVLWGIVLFLAVGSFTLLMLTRPRGTRVRGSCGAAPPAASHDTAVALADAQQIGSLLTRLEDTSRRLADDVESRFARLESVIHDADDRLAKLAALCDPSASGTNGRLTSALRENHAVGGRGPVAARSRFQVDSHRRPTTDLRAATDLLRQIAQEQTASQPDGDGPTLITSGLQGAAIHDRVYEMADAGTAPIAIAEALGLMLGEVELILNLRTSPSMRTI